MKRIFFVLTVLIIFLTACGTKEPMTVTSYIPKNPLVDTFVSDIVLDNFEQYCQGKAQWIGNIRAMGLSTNYDDETDYPIHVTVTVNPSVLWDDYSVGFGKYRSYAYKNGVELTGDERDQAIRQALIKVEGVTALQLTFNVTVVDDSLITASDFICSIP